MIGDTTQQGSLTRRLQLELHMGDGAGAMTTSNRPSPRTWQAIETSPLRGQRISGAHAHGSGSLTRPAQERGHAPDPAQAVPAG
jgi:hypothetical protein